MSDDTPETAGESTRRTVLRALGVAGTAAALGGLAGAQETTQGGTTRETTQAGTTTADEQTNVILGAEVEYWLGIAPDPIQGEENPTLALEPGEQYLVTWINVDGERHRFQILDGNDEVLVESGDGEGIVSVVSVGFTATEEMARYRCLYHPDSMQGEVRQGSFGTTETEGEAATTEAGGGTETTEAARTETIDY